MEFIFVLIMLYLVFGRQDRDSSSSGGVEFCRATLKGIALGLLLLVALKPLKGGFEFFPVFIGSLLVSLALALLWLIGSYFYRRYNSPEVLRTACLKRMRDRHCELSLHVYRMEEGRFAGRLFEAKTKASELMTLYRVALRQYQKAPESGFESFYERQLAGLEARIEAVLKRDSDGKN
ncbi:MAG: hypothetical protein K2X27_18110 [Candidatus Obscuribacterales bacterium]|nr:hypothetical protein [Candidatus Obscuribacterales bacterium]